MQKTKEVDHFYFFLFILSPLLGTALTRLLQTHAGPQKREAVDIVQSVLTLPAVLLIVRPHREEDVEHHNEGKGPELPRLITGPPHHMARLNHRLELAHTLPQLFRRGSLDVNLSPAAGHRPDGQLAVMNGVFTFPRWPHETVVTGCMHAMRLRLLHTARGAAFVGRSRAEGLPAAEGKGAALGSGRRTGGGAAAEQSRHGTAEHVLGVRCGFSSGRAREMIGSKRKKRRRKHYQEAMHKRHRKGGRKHWDRGKFTTPPGAPGNGISLNGH